MSDLVKRLRGETDLGECGRLCDEAATAVERLERTVERVRAKALTASRSPDRAKSGFALAILRELEREEECPIHADVDWEEYTRCPHCGKGRRREEAKG